MGGEAWWGVVRPSIPVGVLLGLLSLGLAVAFFDEPLSEFSGPRFLPGEHQEGWLRVAQNIPVFVVGGILFAFFVGLVFAVLHSRIPLGSSVLRGVVVALLLWGVFQAINLVANQVNPARFNLNPSEILRGFVLMLVLGSSFGYLWGRRPSPATPDSA